MDRCTTSASPSTTMSAQVDKYFNPQHGWHGNDANVAFQMDGDYRQDPYSVWLDNVSFSSW